MMAVLKAEKMAVYWVEETVAKKAAWWVAGMAATKDFLSVEKWEYSLVDYLVLQLVD